MASNLAFRLGPRRVAQVATGGGCEEDCSCIQELFRLNDDFCSSPGTDLSAYNDTWEMIAFQGGITQIIGRTSGWWELLTPNDPDLAPSTRFSTWGPCLGIPAVAGERLVAKTHVVMSQANPVISPGRFDWFLTCLGPGPSGFAVAFTTSPVFGAFWAIKHVEASILQPNFPTTVPVSVDCNNPDALKIIATSSLIRFLINDVQVHSIVPSANMKNTPMKMFYELTTNALNHPVQRMQVDLACARMTRGACKFGSF